VNAANHRSRPAERSTVRDKPKKRSSVLRTAGIVLFACLLLLIGAGGLFGPAIVAQFVPGVIESAAADRLNGSVEVRDVSLSWAGPQRIGGLTVNDAQGRRVASIEASTGASLLGLAVGGLDLGTVTVRGDTLDIVKNEDGSLNIATLFKDDPQATDEPTTLPEGLAIQLDASFNAVTWTVKSDDGQSRTVELRDVTLNGAIDTGTSAPASLTLTATDADGNAALDIAVSGSAIAPDRTLRLFPNDLEAKLDAQLTARDLAVLLGVTPAAGEESARWRAEATLEASDGSLVARGTPVIRGRVPERLMQTLAAEGVEVTLDEPPTVALTIPQFRIPLPSAQTPWAQQDFTTAQLAAQLTFGAMRGSLTLPDVGRRSLEFPATTGGLQLAQHASSLGARMVLRPQLDRQEAGAIEIRASATGLLDSNGRLRASEQASLWNPETLSAAISAKDMRAELFDQLAAAFAPGLLTGSLERAAGGPVDLVLEANVPSPGEGDDAIPGFLHGTPLINASLTSPLTTASAVAALEPDRLRTAGRGINISTNAPAEVLDLLATADTIQVRSENGARLNLSIPNATLSRTQAGIDLARSTAQATLEAAGLTVSGVADTAVTANQLSLELDLQQGGTLVWTANANATTRGEDFTLASTGTVANLAATSGGGTLGFDFAAATYSGELTTEGLPTDLLEVASADAAVIAAAALGQTLSGSVASAGSTSMFHVDLTGDRGSIAGEAGLDSNAVVVPASGLTIETTRPGPTLQALERLRGPDADTQLAMRDTGSMSIVLRDARLPLDRPDHAPLKGARGQVALIATALEGRFTALDQPFAIEQLSLDASLTEAGDLAGDVMMNGTASDDALTLNGEFTVDRFHRGSGQIDLTSAAYGVDLRAQLPAALASLLEDRYGIALREAAGDSLAITLDNDSGTAGGIVLTASGDHGFALRTPLSVTASGGQARVVVGKSSVNTRVTPTIVDTFASDVLGRMSDDLRLDRPTRLVIETGAFAIPLVNRVSPNWNAVRAINISLRTPDDEPVILAGVPSFREGETTRVGLLAHTIGIAWRGSAGSDPSAISPNITVFDPAAGSPASRADVLTIDGDLEVPAGNPFARIADLPARSRGMLRLRRGDAQALDTLLKAQGEIQTTLEGQFNGRVEVVPAGQQPGPGMSPIDLTFGAPGLQLTAGFKAVAPGDYRLDKPLTLTSQLDPRTVDRLLLGVGPDEPASEAGGLRVAQRVEYRISITDVGFTDAASLLDTINARLATTDIIVSGADGSYRIPPMDGTLKAQGNGAFAISLAATEQVQAEGPLAPGESTMRTRTSLRLDATVEDIINHQWALTPSTTVVRTLELDGEVPAPLLDAIARTDGVIGAFTSDLTQLNAKATDLSFADRTGRIEASFSSPFSNGRLTGSLDGFVLNIDQGAQVTLLQTTEEFERDVLPRLLILFDRFEKTALDEPMVIDIKRLELPIDGDLAKLNGELRIDPGTLRFRARGVDRLPFIATVLDLAGLQSEGVVGQRFQPFDMPIERGFLYYNKVEVPVGETTIIVDGRMNLQRDRINLILDVPVDRLAEDISRDVLSILNRLPGARELARIPIRVKGPMDDYSVAPDAEEFAKRLPGAALDTVLDLIPDLGGNR
jgi:hypothetical protein